MHTLRRLLSGTLAAILAAAVVTNSAAPASAADGWQRSIDVDENVFENNHPKECRPWSYAEGCFQAYGEWIWLRDTQANNQPVAMQWWWTDKDFGGARSGVVYWDGGKAAGWTNINKSFDEMGYFRFRVCEVNLPAKQLVESTCSPVEPVRT